VLKLAKSDDLTSYLVCMIDVDLCLMLAEVKYAVSYIWSPSKKKGYIWRLCIAYYHIIFRSNALFFVSFSN
jgi:hypothetical protein